MTQQSKSYYAVGALGQLGRGEDREAEGVLAPNLHQMRLAFRLRSDPPAELIRFQSSQCAYSRWMRRVSGRSQFWLSRALWSKYAGLLVGCQMQNV